MDRETLKLSFKKKEDMNGVEMCGTEAKKVKHNAANQFVVSFVVGTH